ncbi:MAG: hypothetical protein AB9836_08380 [Aminipila sp.]
MALHRVKKPEEIQAIRDKIAASEAEERAKIEERARREEKERIKKMEEEQMENIFNNSAHKEMVGVVKNTMEEVIKEQNGSLREDNFFKSEELYGTSTPLSGYEIEIKPEVAIAEGGYNFKTINLNIENGVETIYGKKDKLVLEFQISRIRDGEEFKYDLKQKYNISSSYKSRFYEVYKDLTGEAPRGKIDLRNLLYIEGSCVIKHIPMDNGDIFPRIVDISVQSYKDVSEVPAV